MKKTLFALALCLPLLVSAQQFLSYGTSNTKSTAPTKTVENITNGIIVTYQFDGALVKEDNLYPGTYHWDIDGFTENIIQKKPATLTKTDQIRVPKDMEATVTLLSATYKTYNYELAPARPPLLTNAGGHSLNNVLPVASYSGFYPSTIVESLGMKYYRGNGILNVALHPIRYSKNIKSVKAYNTITYKVTFTPKSEEARTRDGVLSTNIVKNDADSYLSDITISNTNMFSSNSSTKNDKGYLIVTTNKFIDSANKFAAWKNLMGYKTYIAAQTSWTEAKIKETVKKHYKDSNITYLLIIGDYQDVPGASPRTCFISDSTTTSESTNDYAYGCMDGDDDYVADIFRGRLSVSTSQEANTVVEKIINYEKNPVNNTSFWKNSLLCCSFEDGGDGEDPKTILDGVEDNTFFAISNLCYRLFKEYGIDATFALETTDDCNPQIDYYYQEVPEFLKKPNRTWKDNSANITSAINNGKFFVMYSGHGDYYMWMSPKYVNGNVKNLSNGKMLPMVFSFACSTGEYSNTKAPCIAEEFLRKANGGAVSVLAPHWNSFSGTDDIIAHEIINNAYDSKLYTLGELMDRALDQQEEDCIDYFPELPKYVKDTYHLFGDPSMMFNTECPTAFNDVKVRYTNGQVFVSLPANTEAIITLVDNENNDIQSFKGSSAVFTLKNPNSTTAKICVSAHNKIPYIQNVEKPSGSISSSTYDLYEGTFDIKYSLAKTNSASVKIKYNGQVVKELPVDVTKTRMTTALQLGPNVYTIELCADGNTVASRTMTVVLKPAITMTSDDWTGNLYVNYNIFNTVSNAEVRIFRTNDLAIGVHYAKPILSQSINLSSSHSGSVSFNVATMGSGQYTAYLYEDGKYTNSAKVACSPIGPRPALAIEKNTDGKITGKYKFGTGSNPKYGYIRLFKASFDKNGNPSALVNKIGMESYTHYIDINYYIQQIEGSFTINTDKLFDGEYIMALYYENQTSPQAITPVTINTDEQSPSIFTFYDPSTRKVTIDYDRTNYKNCNVAKAYIAICRINSDGSLTKEKTIKLNDYSDRYGTVTYTHPSSSNGYDYRACLYEYDEKINDYTQVDYCDYICGVTANILSVTRSNGMINVKYSIEAGFDEASISVQNINNSYDGGAAILPVDKTLNTISIGTTSNRSGDIYAITIVADRRVVATKKVTIK